MDEKIELLLKNSEEIKEKLRKRVEILAELLSEENEGFDWFTSDIRDSVFELGRLEHLVPDLQQLKQEHI